MKKIKKSSPITLIFVLSALVTLSGCFATATIQEAPPMTKRSGTAPSAAMLPVGNTNDQEVADHVTSHLEKCLRDRNVFEFVSQDKVNKAVAETGFDMGKTFGLSEDEYKTLASKLGVDYVIHGYVTVNKNLTLTGWRKDVDVYIKLHDSATGAKTDSWRSMTGFTWTSSSTSKDSIKMAESAANHTCSKILESTF